MMTMMTLREAKKGKEKARVRKAKVKKARGEEMMPPKAKEMTMTMTLPTMTMRVASLQLVKTVIVEHVSSNGQRGRRLRLATTHATAIHHAKVLATGPQPRPKGIAHYLIRPAVAMASAVG